MAPLMTAAFGTSPIRKENPSRPLRSLARTAVTLTVRGRPPDTTARSAVWPGRSFAISRWRRCARLDAIQPSPMSSRGVLRSMPLMLAMRSPSLMPAFSAGPSSDTPDTNTPSVSRLLPVEETNRPSAARSSSLSRVRRAGSSTSAATVLTFAVRSFPAPQISSVASSPGLSLRISRLNRLGITPVMSLSPASARESLRFTPFIEAMRFPSSIPAFSAGLPSVTEVTSTPRVSRRPSDAVLTPSIARLGSDESTV